MRVRQFAVAVGIMVLLPLLAYCTAELLSPPADWQKYYAQESKYQRQSSKAKKPVEKQAVEQRRLKAKDELAATDKRRQTTLFFTAYAIGLSALILSAFISVPGVAAGLMFGGMFAVMESYFVWDKLSKELRFATLILMLAVLIGLGCWKIRPDVAGQATAS